MRLLVAFHAAGALFAEPPSIQPERIDALFQPCSAPGSPGASVSILHNGKVLFEKSYGLANLEENVRASTRTNYRLASVTKQFTAMAVMVLSDRNRLSLDDRLTRYFEGLPAWGAKVTIRQLLNHTSGIPAYEPAVEHIRLEEVTPEKQLKDKDVLEILKKQESTYFEPGAQYRYSNSGYALLALIVERASGMPFARFLKKNIFEPLEMSGTVAFEEGVSVVHNRAYGYIKEGDRFVRRDQSATSAVLGDGGIYSSVEDLSKWDNALTAGKLVKAATWKQAVTPGVLNDGRPTTYGFGWEISKWVGRTAWRHSGGTVGFTTHILRLPEDRLTVIVLENRVDLSPAGSAAAIAAMLTGTR